MALAAINVARYEFGLDIGREISIVGYDDVPMAAWPAFSLTTYAQPAEKMVEATVSVIGALRKAPEAHAHVTIEGQLRVRGSTRPIPYTR
jgi:DNA-binding LacI/PurR family transcriptional regulator